MALSEISEVEVHPVEGEDLWGFHLDAPQAGDSHDAYAFDVRGWALGRRNKVTSVELKDGPRLLWRVPTEIARNELADTYPQAQGTEAAGFFTIVNSLNLNPEFEILVRARLEDRSRVDLVTLRGRREPLRTAYEPRIQPLMVTTLGRTGSTILMKVLATHPEVVACPPFEQEARVATYWLGVMNTLTDPVSYRRQINPTGTIDGTWWVGKEPPLPRRPRDTRLTRWLDVDAVTQIASFCQSRIEAVYEEVAMGAGLESLRFFAEKYRPDRIPEMMWELYPRAREVILVRDFRDMVASMFAYNVKRGRMGFRRDQFDDDAQYVIEQVKTSVSALADAWEARRDSAHLVRYEDLVLDSENTIESLLRYLGLEAEAHADEMAASLSARDPETEWHRTTPDPRASIGRWRDDLTGEARRACEDVLAPELQTFGYPLEEATV
jgi:sulfotransferase family protein